MFSQLKGFQCLLDSHVKVAVLLTGPVSEYVSTIIKSFFPVWASMRPSWSAQKVNSVVPAATLYTVNMQHITELCHCRQFKQGPSFLGPLWLCSLTSQLTKLLYSKCLFFPLLSSIDLVLRTCSSVICQIIFKKYTFFRFSIFLSFSLCVKWCEITKWLIRVFILIISSSSGNAACSFNRVSSAPTAVSDKLAGVRGWHTAQLAPIKYGAHALYSKAF